jgi:hypothetical protein
MIWALVILSGFDLLSVGIGERQPAFFDSWFVLVHVAVTVVALAICLHQMIRTRSLDPIGLVIGASFGPAGMLTLALVKPWQWFSGRPRKGAREKPKKDEAPGERTDDTTSIMARTLDDRVSYPEPDQIGSLVSTLRYGDRESRHKALQAVVRSFEPQLSPLIAVALTDKDQTLRAIAAAASAQINYEVGQRYLEMEEKVSRSASIEDTLPLVLSVASHGSHNVLLPQSQRLHLTQSSSRHLEELGPQLVGPQRKQVAIAQREIARAHDQLGAEVVNRQGPQ